MRNGIVFALTLWALALPATAAAQSAVPAACQYVLGFRSLHDLAADAVGDCQDNQATMPNGDAQQHTTKGLMAWRKADNWTAFTNGYQTWINGPDGVVSRLNTDRFLWEAPAKQVLTSDNFADSSKGALPQAYSDDSKAMAGYVNGEYELKEKVAGFGPTAGPLAVYTDTAAAVEARIVGDTSDRAVTMVCRRSTDGNNEYRVIVRPGTGRVQLERKDASDKFIALAGPADVPAVNRGNASNHIELTCAGSNISATVNGALAVSATDATYGQGLTRLGAFGSKSKGPVEAYFANFVVTRP